MRKGSTIFLRIVILIIGTAAVIGLVRFPLTEGRAVNLDLFSIYSDPFIIYAYIASIPFFIGLYQAFLLLGYIEQNKVFSLNSVRALKIIKYSASLLSVLIILAVGYVKIFHNNNDDPAGFIALGILTTFSSIVTAAAAAVFEKTLQSAVEIKHENDLTV